MQRSVLRVLEASALEGSGIDALVDTFALAARVFEVRPDADEVQLLTRAQLSSVRRALARLRDEGLVDGRRGFRDGRQRWGTTAAITGYDERVRTAFGVRSGAAS